MKYKTIVCIAILMFILNIGLANSNQKQFDKQSLQPGKPGTSDAITVTNNFYDLIVENIANNNGIGTYTVRTGSSHPATIALGSKQNVLYGGASGSPWSTYLTVKSYNSHTNYVTTTDYPTADSGCTTMQLDWTSTSIAQPTPTSILCVWDIIGENDFLKIKQNTFIDGTTLDDSKIGVTTTVKNTGYDTVKIGIRYEWDIMIDGNDATPFRTKNPEGPWLSTETQWSSFNYTHYEITDYPSTPTFYNLGSVIGPTYLTPPPSPPDLLSYASWSNSYGYAFNYTLQGYSGMDSAILYYWGNDLAHAIKIAPGDSVMVTQYLFASLLTINYQVDNQIKNSNDVSYIGDNIYNLTGTDQTKSQTIAPNITATYNVKIENDGTGQDGFLVSSVQPAQDEGWNVQYFDALTGGNNITSQVTSTGWSTGGLNPGQSREIRIEVTPDITIPTGATLQTFLMSTSQNDNTKKDVVLASTTVGTYHDVGVSAILAPTGSIESGTVVTPRATIRNFGNDSATGTVYFQFGTYNSNRSFHLLSSQAVTIDFDVWTAAEGSYAEKAFTVYGLDQNVSNDTAYGQFIVTSQTAHDVGVTRIIAPTGTIAHGVSVTPRATVKNFGQDVSETFSVCFKIGDVYNQIATVTNLGRGETLQVAFPGWTTTGCVYVTSCSTRLALDQDTTNDRMIGIVDVVPQGREIQTDWISGPGVSGPVAHWGSSYLSSDSINNTVFGQISLITTGTAGTDAYWQKHVIETDIEIDGHNAIFPADFDGDGDLDLAGAMDGYNAVRIYRNQKVETGIDTFIPVNDLPANVGPDCILSCGDLNLDGLPDIVVPQPNGTGWFENTGNFTFTYHAIDTTSHASPCCDIGDIDNDGDIDIIVGDRPLTRYRNNGLMVFTPTRISAGTWWRANLGHLNSDNLLDLLAAERVRINTGSGNFPTTANWSAAGLHADGHWICDIDNDGYNDIVLTDDSTDAIYWYKNSGTGIAYTQNAIRLPSADVYYGSACIAKDIDLDGKADVVAVKNRVGLFKQITPTDFQEIVIDSSFTSARWCYLANLDSAPGSTDHDLDILATDHDQFAWWENPAGGYLYANYGQLISSVIEIPKAYTWKALNWFGSRPQNSDLMFYIRSSTSNTAIQTAPWQGPFKADIGYPGGGFNITGYTNQGDHFFQYKVVMIGGNTQTPVVYDVSVDYDTFAVPGYHDVRVYNIITPSDSFTSNPIRPMIDIVSGWNDTEICTVDVNIWRFRVKMDSFCHISIVTTDSVLVYSASLPTAVNPGHNNVSMDTWRPYFSDIYWVGGHHTIVAKVRMNGDTFPNNNSLLRTFIVRGNINDLQMNWTGLLNVNTPMNTESIGIRTYNVASVVSTSPGGSSARFRAWAKIIRNRDNAVVYNRYQDLTMLPGTYNCISFRTGWTPTEVGGYTVRSFIQSLPQYNTFVRNDSTDKHYYVGNILSSVNNDENQSLQSNSFGIPTYFNLMANRPNPFSNITNIQWQIPVRANVTITIYDATGRNIKTLANSSYATGYYNTTWNRTNDNNQKISAGIYFYEMRTNDYTARHKMIITN